jgi:glycosyltransferase involved in cell wall biosynthesis
MHVIILNDFGHVNGGAAKVAIDSACEIGRRGIRTTYFTAVNPVAAQLGEAGVHVVCTDQDELVRTRNKAEAAVRGIWNRKAAERMRALLSRGDRQKTVIHVHGWTKALSSAPVRVAARMGFQVVLTFHDYFLACPNGGFFDYQMNKICTLKPLGLACLARHCDVRSYGQKLYRVARQVVQQHFGLLPSGVQHYIAPSELGACVLRPFLPDGVKVHHVDNPIDAELKAPVAVGENVLFVTVARLSPEKGGLLAAQAASAIGASLDIVGDGVQAKVIQKIAEDIRVIGWLEPERVLAKLQEARALVLPSLWYEIQPLVVLQALARGVPAIVASSSGARELVENGVTGLWFRGGDVVDLADKMKMIMKDDKLAAKLGRAAYRKYWERPRSVKTHVDTLLTVYRSMLDV